MTATIALIGRPNVGKSTLFNRLTRSRNALVNKRPGVTRDRQYGRAQLDNKSVIVIDSGGLDTASTTLNTLMYQQVTVALKEADLILFLLDLKSGCTNNDLILAHQLRKLAKPIIPVINKIDVKSEESLVTDFYSLGLGTPLAISAEHNLGITELKNTIAAHLPPIAELPFPVLPPQMIKIACLGRPNVGKSTLINRIVGEERVITHNEPGTTRDTIFINFKRRNEEYILIDTAGIRRRSKIKADIEKFSVSKSFQAIKIANVIILVIDATTNITEQDLKLLGLVVEAGKALVLAINKWDLLTPQQRKNIKSELERRLTFSKFVTLHFISALHGSGVGSLFSTIKKAYQNATQELKTATLNQILAAATQNLPPPLVNGRAIKLRYAHAGDHNPPTIIIHGTRTSSLPASYRRYLEHYFRKSLKLSGTPLKILLRHNQ